MAETSIPFLPDMVDAILNTSDERTPIDQDYAFKYVTRRLIKPQPFQDNLSPTAIAKLIATAPYKKGAVCWVREHFYHSGPKGSGIQPPYQYIKEGISRPDGMRYSTYRFMPRAASRLTVKITSLRVEQLQDISDEQAIAEGIQINSHFEPPLWRNYHVPIGTVDAWLSSPRQSFQTMFEMIHDRDIWTENPWVYVIEFEKNWSLTTNDGSDGSVSTKAILAGSST